MALTLILTSERDPTADYLERAFSAAGLKTARVVVDEKRFPFIHLEVSGDASDGWVDSSRGRILVHETKAVIFRKPQAPVFEAAGAGPARFLSREALGGLRGVLEASDALWVNHPIALSRSDSKPANLRLAADLGLEVPRTLVSSSPEDIRRWIEGMKSRRLVMKAVTHGLIESPEKTEMIFAEPLPSAFDPTSDLEPGVPIMIQERIEKEADVRVNVIGSRVFAASFPTPSDVLDWRVLEHDKGWHAEELPNAVSSRVLEMCSRLGLKFAAIDFALSRGRWYFLELNPNGQWAWIEEATGQPLSDAFCELVRGHLSGL